jgi:hypothetical protein
LVYDTASVLAEWSTSGRSWRQAGAALFALGNPVPLDCLRDCARWQAEQSAARVRHWWREAQALTPAQRDPADEREDVAQSAAAFALRSASMGRALRRTQAVLLESPYISGLTARDQEAAMAESLGWRLADSIGLQLTAEERHIVRYGSRDAPATVFRPPLPSERNVCIETMTLREMCAVRRHIVARIQAGMLETDRNGLDITVWTLAEFRLNVGWRDVAQPLSVAKTDALDEEAADFEAFAEVEVPGQLELELWEAEEVDDEDDAGAGAHINLARSNDAEMNASYHWAEPVHCSEDNDAYHRLQAPAQRCGVPLHAWIDASEQELTEWLRSAGSALLSSWLGATAVPHPARDHE